MVCYTTNMSNYKIIVQYNGANYSGWQVQENKNTIQGCLQQAIYNVTAENTEVNGCGRTDAGVSAMAAVANFFINQEFEPNKLGRAINAHLPADIAVLSCEIVPDAFNARFDAKSKTYHYYFYISGTRNPLLDKFALQVKNANVADMMDACKHLVGTHDFKSFVARNSGKTNFERTIYNAGIEQVNGNLYRFSVCGNGFLYNMVRIIMGTLILIGEGKRKPDAIRDIMLAKDRTKAGKTVDPIGLMIYNVEY